MLELVKFKRIRNSPWMRHVSVLVWKNVLVCLRSKTSSMIQLGSPLLICIYLLLLQGVANSIVSREEERSPEPFTVGIPKCSGSDCVSLAIAITGNKTEWADYVVAHIAKSEDLTIGKSLKLYQGSLEFIDFLYQNQNTTQVGIILCTDEIRLPIDWYVDSLPCGLTNGNDFIYSIVYNNTEIQLRAFAEFLPDFISKSAVGAKLAVDNALFEYQSMKTFGEKASIELLVSSFPRSVSRFDKGYDLVSDGGPLYFFICPMILFGMVAAEIVKEKEQHLRHGLLVMGVSNSEFWVSWLVTAVLLVFTQTNVQILSGYLFSFDFFLNTPYL